MAAPYRRALIVACFSGPMSISISLSTRSVWNKINTVNRHCYVIKCRVALHIEPLILYPLIMMDQMQCSQQGPNTCLLHAHYMHTTCTLHACYVDTTSMLPQTRSRCISYSGQRPTLGWSISPLSGASIFPFCVLTWESRGSDHHCYTANQWQLRTRTLPHTLRHTDHNKRHIMTGS